MVHSFVCISSLVPIDGYRCEQKVIWGLILKSGDLGSINDLGINRISEDF
ncbi:unnamed protein product [Meloidogyne enterolobii]|uniref:Uncharacterized protein n=1 Tax=Meloidogyne enterolobii TaxID=390850 RepID=A0ACB0Y667_MELEN